MPRSSQITDAGPIARLALTTTNPAIFQALTPKLAAPSLAAILAVPGSMRLDSRVFNVRATGTIYNAGAAGTAGVSFYTGTDTVVANDAIFATTGLVAVPTLTAYPFHLDANLLFDSIGGVLFGDCSGFVGPNLIARAAITSNLAGLNGNNEPVFNIVLCAFSSVANAASYAVCNTFALEA